MKQTEAQGVGNPVQRMYAGDINLIPNISNDDLDAVAEFITKDILSLSRMGPLDEMDVLERVKGPIYAMVNRSRN